MKNMKIDANGTEIRVIGDVVNEEAYISLTDIAKYKNPDNAFIVVANWMRNYDTIIIILRFHFWACGNKFTIPILNLSNSIGLKQSLVIMRLR